MNAVKLTTICLLLVVTACASLPPVAPRLEPTVLLISLDGYRWDYPTKYPTPHLAAFRQRARRAERLLPIFPTTTFPNHYSIATGLYAEDHGVVGNEMYDPANGARFNPKTADDSQWWGGEPIWVTAEKQGIATGTIFWVGANAAIQGMRPKHYRAYDGSIPAETRVRQVLDWLALPASQRPRLMTLYFEDIDSAGHRFGPDSAEVHRAIERVDQAIGLLDKELAQRGWADQINCLFVSDHGMAAVEKNQFLALAPLLGKEKVELSGYGAVVHLFTAAKNLATLEAKLQRPGLMTYRKAKIPTALHYRKNSRIGDLVLIADEGWYLVPPGGKQGPDNTKGAHGYLPDLPSMHGVFFAAGPAFQANSDLGPVHNVSLYALMASLLGLTPVATSAWPGEVAAMKP